MTKTQSAWPTIVFFLGVGFTLMVLATGLPLRSVSQNGQWATVAVYLLNPPVLLIETAIPHGAHDLEQSWWPQLAYPITAVVSVLWWGIVRILLVQILRRRNTSTNGQ